jgi:DNA sulfur modification protein DndC
MSIRDSQPTLFEGERLGLDDSIELTIRSLQAHGAERRHWAIAYSGGKDSTTVLTLVMHLVKTGRVPRPERLTVCYADTRMELPPLAAVANQMLRILAAEGIDTRVAVAPMDKRFLVYMLGRGVPPPNNTTFRWCTRQIKIDPMQAALEQLAAEAGEKILMLTGVRIGESAARDAKIAVSCGKNGSECGQGWYQETMPDSLCDTLAPILHWRTCLVWDWLMGQLEREWRHGYPTELVAEAYGLNAEGSAGEINARTGCNGCPLATVDTALDNLLRFPRWRYLAPLKELRPVFRTLREPANRLRKPGFETAKDGTIRWTNRLGPIVLDARRSALNEILGIQRRCNVEAPPDAPRVDMLDESEVARINELIAAGQWPDRWSGDEPTGDIEFERRHADGSLQGNLWLAANQLSGDFDAQ